MRNAYAWLFLLLPFPLTAQSGGTLKGRVIGEDAAPLPQARIRLVGTNPVVLSSADGRFNLGTVADGDQVLEVRLLGYVALLKPVKIAEGQTVDVEVTLVLAPLPLKAVEVKGAPALLPAMQGFEMRRAHGNGHFFNRAEIARMQPRVFTDVLRRVPGVQIQPGGSSFGSNEMVRMSRTIGVTGSRSCPVLFYVNGSPFTVLGDMSINQYVAPEDVSAIEVYSGTSQIPPEFQSTLLNSRCGVIVIWTRVGNEDEPAPPAPPAPLL